MKRKIYLAVMAAAVISMAGCGKKTADTSTDATPEPTQEATVTEEATPGRRTCTGYTGSRDNKRR